MSTSLGEIERVFLALGDKTRIRLVDLMRDGEVSVNYLCETLNESQPKVSRHLAYLRSMGMVNTRRDGKWVYYSLAEPENRFGSRLLYATLDWIGSISRGNGHNAVPRQHVEVLPPAVEPGISDRSNICGYTDMKVVSDELEIYLL